MRFFSIIPAQKFMVLACDLLLAGGIYIGVTYLLYGDSAAAFFTEPNGWLRLLLAMLSILGGLYYNELYTVLRVSSRVALGLKLSHVFGLSLVFQTFLAYLDPNLGMPRKVVLVATVVAYVAMFLWRVTYSGFLWNLFGFQNVVIVGSGLLVEELAREIAERPQRGIRLVGYVGTPNDRVQGAYLGPGDQLAAIVTELKPDRVVVASSSDFSDMPVEELLKLRRRGIVIEEGARTYEMLCSRVCSSEFRPELFIFDDTLIHRPGSMALQSIYINLLALAGIIVLSPILILLGILVKVTSRGPIFEVVPCVGYRGIPFTMNRFRVARVAPEASRVVLTGMGRFLLKTHLDLLPAMFNLLRGEMSLVGPRPDRPEIAEELAARIPFYEQRYALKPGLTGWSQINMDPSGRPADGLIALEYDLYYLKNMSLSLDAYILLHRVRHILSFGM